MQVKILTLEGKTYDLSFKENITLQAIRAKLKDEYNYDADRCYFCRDGKILDEGGLPKVDSGAPIIIFNPKAFPDKSYPRVDDAVNLSFSRYSDSFVNPRLTNSNLNNHTARLISSTELLDDFLGLPPNPQRGPAPRIVITHRNGLRNINPNRPAPVEDEQNSDHSFSEENDEPLQANQNRTRPNVRIIRLSSRDGAEEIVIPTGIEHEIFQDDLMNQDDQANERLSHTHQFLHRMLQLINHSPQNGPNFYDQEFLDNENENIDHLEGLENIEDENNNLENDILAPPIIDIPNNNPDTINDEINAINTDDIYNDTRNHIDTLINQIADLNLQLNRIEDPILNQQNQDDDEQQQQDLDQEDQSPEQRQRELEEENRRLEQRHQELLQQQQRLNQEHQQLEQRQQQLEQQNRQLAQEHQRLEAENRRLARGLHQIETPTNVIDRERIPTQGTDRGTPGAADGALGAQRNRLDRMQTELNRQIIEGLNLNVNLTEEDNQAISRLSRAGFDRATVIQVYYACDRDEETAMNLMVAMGE